MKGQRVSPTRPRTAFTLIELLVVIAVIAILAVMLLPAIEKARARAKQAACMSNLHQIGFGFHSFKHDHDNLLPTGVPMKAGGVKELFATPLGGLKPDWRGHVWRIFQSMSNHLVRTEILICHADKLSKPATNFPSMNMGRFCLSYFAIVCLPGQCEDPNAVWAGDATFEPTNVWVYASESMFAIDSWALHGGTRGNHLFADGRVEKVGRDGPGIGFAGTPEQIVKVPPGLSPPPTETASTGPQSRSGGGSSGASSGSSGSASAGGGGRSGGGGGARGGGGSASQPPGLLPLLEQALGGPKEPVASPPPASRTPVIAKSQPTPAAVPVAVASSNIARRIGTQEVYVSKGAVVQTNAQPEAEDPILAETPIVAASSSNSSFRFWVLLVMVLIAGVLVLWYLRHRRAIGSQPDVAAGT